MTPAAKKALDELDPRMRGAVIGYAEGKSMAEAMIESGYSEKYARADGSSKLLANPRFVAAYNALTAATIVPRVDAIQADANETIIGAAAIAHADPAMLTDANHRLLPLREMPPIIRRAIQTVRFDGKGMLVGVGLASKSQALLLLADSQNLRNQPIPAPPPGEDRVAGLTHDAAVTVLKRQSPHLLERPSVGETSTATPANGNGKSNGGNGKGER